jgi:hypothetical protein
MKRQATMTDPKPVSPPPSECAATYPEHSCYWWNCTHYVSAPEYTASQCGVCGKITGFKWRKKRKRLVSLFTSAPLFRKEIAWWFWHTWWRLLSLWRSE